MKQFKKILGTFLAVAFAFTLFTAHPITAKAYNYTINISLASTDDAEFISVDEMIKNKALSMENGEAHIEGNILKLTGLNYGEKVSFNPQEAVKVSSESKYHVKGMRIAGTNMVLAAGAFDVFEDQTYVIAYGVGDIVPYLVHFVNKNGEELLDSATYYAAAGEAVYIPYKYIEGYVPDKYNIPVDHLPKPDDKGNPAEYTFVYTEGKEAKVDNTVVEVVEETVTYGAPIYTFETKHLSSRLDSNDNSAANAGEEANSEGTNRTEVPRDPAADGLVEMAGENSESSNDSTNPADVAEDDEIVEIEDEDVALAGGEEYNRFNRNMIICLLMAVSAILVILVTLFTATRKATGKKNKK